MSVPEVRVDRVPLWVVALHRAARLGRASQVASSKRFVGFDISETLAAKWPDLKDVAHVTFIYSERGGLK